jgi:SAM-dependent methyltransferase
MVHGAEPLSILERLRRSGPGRAWGQMRDFVLLRLPGCYARRVADERERFDQVTVVNDLPEIFHYWSHNHVRPMLQEFGVGDPIEFFAEQIRVLDLECPSILSLGAGNCDLEISVAKALVAAGARGFRFRCLDLNVHMLERGRALAAAAGLGERFEFEACDINEWRHDGRCDVVIANQSLHHVVALEQLFAEVRRAIGPGGVFLVSDIIGRNGHLRWPEALAEVDRFWHQLPATHRYNHQLKRQEERFEDWDCSHQGFEGIRAQDILPLLLRFFHFRLFIPFGNVIDVFVDRSFGPNFAIADARDREFIDRVHARDEELLGQGLLTPTHLLGVLGVEPCAAPRWSRGLRPERCVRPTPIRG